jgi:hypothetical protein
MQKVHDRVQETGTATTGVITLTGAVAGFTSFSAKYIIGEPIYFAAVDGTTWGVHEGLLLSSTSLQIIETYESSSFTGTPPNVVHTRPTYSGASMNIFATIPSENIEELWSKGQTTAMVNGLILQ